MMGITKTITWRDVETYQRLREASRKLMNLMTKTIPRAAYDEIGAALGILRKGVLVFDTEDVAAVLADCCLHDWIRDGENLVAKYSLDHPPFPGTDEEYLLLAHQRARFRILVPGSIAPGAGLECTDTLSGESLFLMDVALSQCAQEGRTLFATRTVPLDGYWMTTGAGLPIGDNKTGKEVIREVETFLKAPPVNAHKLALAVLRKCLDGGAAEYVTYAGTEEIEDAGESENDIAVPPQPAIPRRGPGRNAPCPCGSGKKYKKCHWSQTR
jgi:hypothetical protein